MERPVYRLRKAFYRHPDAGAYLEQKCDKHVRSVGSMPVGEEWPSCYWPEKPRLFLAIYVGDCKLAGPAGSLAD
eukprot:115784-Alexandrium_andersonii.AAC.1